MGQSPPGGAKHREKEKPMKKIIANKVYDTDTALFLGSACANGMTPRDFQYWSEALYQKRTGEYFLYGEGGPMTKYAVSEGQNSWSGGEKIMPLSYDAAREWAEKRLDADRYEAAFGVVTENDTITAMHVHIDSALYARAKQAAAQNGSTLAALVEDALRAALEPRQATE